MPSDNPAYSGKRLRNDIVILVVSLLISSVIWLIHYLSQRYVAYFPIRVEAVTDIEGYSSTAVSGETIVVGGQATGFYILRRHIDGGQPLQLKVKVASSEFSLGEGGAFFLESSSLMDELSEAVGSELDISYIQDVRLTFGFIPQSFRRVPLEANISVTCAPQYMQVSEVALKPDSVTVYGNASDIERLSKIDTKPLSIFSLDHSANGIVGLTPGKFRIEPEKVEYSIEVARYVEHTFSVSLSPVNVPEGRTLILLPSRVEVTCRLPFAVRPDALMSSGAFVVDYADFAASHSTQVRPKLAREGEVTVYSWSADPPFVECALSEK